MRQGLALTIPTADEIGSVAKTVAAVGGVVGGAWAIFSRWVKRQRERKLRRELEAKAIRYLLDAVRHSLNAMTPQDRRSIDVDIDELVRQKALIDEMRDQLWVCDGHASERETQRQAEDIIRVLTRTQAIRIAKDRRQLKHDASSTGEVSMFKDQE